MNNLPDIGPGRRVLGVIRPTVERISSIAQARHVEVLATAGTIKLESYPLEIHKFSPDIEVSGEACPTWASLVENNEANGEGTDSFIRRYIHNLFAKDGQIDIIALRYAHYPLLLPKIQQFVSQSVKVVAQGEYVAAGLKGYLYEHLEMDRKCVWGGSCSFCTTEAKNKFAESASTFLSQDIMVQRMSLEQSICKVTLSRFFLLYLQEITT